MRNLTSAALAVAALSLLSCSATRKVTTNTTEAESTRQVETRSSSADSTRELLKMDSTVAYHKTETTTERAEAEETETTTVATTYDPAGRPVLVKTERRTRGTTKRDAGFIQGGDIAASVRKETTKTRTATASTELKEKTTERRKTKAVEVVTVPWYVKLRRWLILGGVAVAAYFTFPLWGPLLGNAWSWFLLLFRRKKKAEDAKL